MHNNDNEVCHDSLLLVHEKFFAWLFPHFAAHLLLLVGGATLAHRRRHSAGAREPRAEDLHGQTVLMFLSVSKNGWPQLMFFFLFPLTALIAAYLPTY